MKKHNPLNERVKHKYRGFLKEARRQSEASVDAVESSLALFEKYNGYTDFKKFHHKQAVGFKAFLAKQTNKRTGKPLSKSTMNRTAKSLKEFFQWLSRETGYKSAISYSDAEYFNLSEKDVRAASGKRSKSYPTLEQIEKVLRVMPATSAIEKRNRALIAFTIMTGARDSAIASFKLKHIDLEAGVVHQDGRDVKTKFSKTFDTVFFEVGDEIREIFREWVGYLRSELLWGHDDPLFPSTKIGVREDKGFYAVGLKREHWKNADPIRRIFKDAFLAAGLPTHNPHRFRDTLTSIGFKRCKTPEEFKAWSNNLGHESVLTTLTNYGDIPMDRQTEVIQGLKTNHSGAASDQTEMMKEILSLVREKNQT